MCQLVARYILDLHVLFIALHVERVIVSQPCVDRFCNGYGLFVYSQRFQLIFHFTSQHKRDQRNHVDEYHLGVRKYSLKFWISQSYCHKI